MDDWHKTLKVSSLTFKKKEFEDAFWVYYNRINLGHGRLCQILAILFCAADGVRDFVLFPSELPWLLFIRYGVIVPFFTGGLLLSYLKPFFYQKIWQPLFAVYFLVTGVGAIAISVLTPAPLGSSLYIGLIYCMIFGYTFIRLRFVLATLAGLLLTGAYFIATLFIIPIEPGLLWIHLPFVFGINALGMVVAYTIEYHFRKDFFFQQLLKEQKELLDIANINLEKRVNKRTRELELSNRMLETKIDALHNSESDKRELEVKLRQSYKMEAIGTLAGGIAHDFNNILYPIIGFAEMSLNDLSDDHPVKENIEDILQGAKRAQNLVKQILSFSSQRESNQRPLTLQPVIEEVLKLLRSAIPSNITIVRDLSDDIGHVFANPVDVHKIVMNICTNAYHAMENTGGTLKISLRKIEPDSILNPPEKAYCCLSISDTGVGIPSENIHYIFDPYFTTKEQGKGSGLGLSVIHGIVKSYEGKIKVESRPGKGSVFRVYLPTIKKAALTNTEQKTEKLPTGNERILLVDDEKKIVKMGTRLLEGLGYKVIGKLSSLEALTLFESDPDKFDLVITDLAMPGMAGTEFAQNLINIRPDIPIIICTGFIEKIHENQTKALGIEEFINKPISSIVLSKTVRNVLDNSIRNKHGKNTLN